MRGLVDSLIVTRYRSIFSSACGRQTAQILESIFCGDVLEGQNLLKKDFSDPSLACPSSEPDFHRVAGCEAEGEPFLSIGLPSNYINSGVSGLPLVWAPHGLPSGMPIFLASSRLSRSLDELDSWFDALRTQAAKMVGGNHCFVTAEKTTTDRFVRRASANFGIPLVAFAFQHQPDRFFVDELKSSSLDKGNSITDPNRLEYPCFVFDLAQADETGAVPESKWCADRFLISVATEVVFLAVRKGGNIDRCVRQRLERERSTSASTSTCTSKLLISEHTKPALRSELLSLGAIGWWLFDENQQCSPEDSSCGPAARKKIGTVAADSSVSQTSSDRNSACPEQVPILKLEEFPAKQFLMHWTRSCFGPWPDQSEDEYLDDLIFRSERRRHGDRSALCRILATGRILATRRLTRDSMPVVAFSNQQLTNINNLTVFRQHLGRWDFVPFGLAIERDWLKQNGAQEVIYGDEEMWKSMSESDRPFFQMARSRSGKIDWTIEKEWRLIGDLNLIKVPQNSIAVFVATQADADAIREFSRWPIVVLNEP